MGTVDVSSVSCAATGSGPSAGYQVDILGVLGADQVDLSIIISQGTYTGPGTYTSNVLAEFTDANLNGGAGATWDNRTSADFPGTVTVGTDQASGLFTFTLTQGGDSAHALHISGSWHVSHC